MKLTLKMMVLVPFCYSSLSMAQLSVNVGAVSDYVWRGITQNVSDPSFSAGLDWADSSGFYLGTWAANVADPGEVEVNGWLGWGGESKVGFTWDLGFIYYGYTGESDLNFEELYASVGYKWFRIKYSDDSDNDTTYLEANLDFSLPADYGLSLHAGDYDLGNNVSTNDYMISLNKNWYRVNLMIAYSQLDIEAGSFSNDEDTFFGGLTWTWTKGN